ncbi:MAG: response regulator [Candidatus Microsaccharimonas sp.]
MAKILLVEDDKSLREIYGVRLQAEGYTIVSAGDGEEALALAIKERPDLIVSDVMMPKISGFDMLDILRSTSETKNIKVIMMTALSSDDQRARGEALGADRYLVKSQVGIEDVVRTVHDVLGDGVAGAAPAAPAFPPTASPVVDTPADLTQPAPATAPVPTPDPLAVAAPIDVPTPLPEPSSLPPIMPATEPAPAPVSEPILPPVINLPPQPAPAAPVVPEPAPVVTPPVAPIAPVMPEPTPGPIVEPEMPVAPVAPITPEPIVTPIAPIPIAPIPTAPAAPAPFTLPEPTAPFSSPRPASLGDRVINPINPVEIGATSDLAAQMNQELNASANPLPPQPTAPAVPPLPPQPPIPPMPPAPGTSL